MPQFNLSVTEEDIKILSAALTELPYKYSAALIAKLQEQINAQVTAAQPEVQGEA